MHNNDVLRRVRYALDLSDAAVVELMELGGRPITRPALASMFQRDDAPDFLPADDHTIIALLDGLILKNRGPREGASAPAVVHLDNNLILQKLRIALTLREDDLIAVMKTAGVVVSRGELSALFRAKGHSNYRPCLDQFLRSFLAGVAETRQRGVSTRTRGAIPDSP